MRYLCLIYDDEKKWPSMPKAEADAMMGDYFAFTEGIKQSGHYVGGDALQPTSTATACASARARPPRPTARSPRPRNSSAATT